MRRRIESNKVGLEIVSSVTHNHFRLGVQINPQRGGQSGLVGSHT